jgi:hypothetical protein
MKIIYVNIYLIISHYNIIKPSYTTPDWQNVRKWENKTGLRPRMLVGFFTNTKI